MKFNIQIKAILDGGTPTSQQIQQDILERLSSETLIYELGLDRQVKVKYNVVKIKESLKRKPKNIEPAVLPCEHSYREDSTVCEICGS